MDQNSYNKNSPRIIHIKNVASPNRLKIGGSMILGQKFDIKKYLTNINPNQKNIKKENINLQILDNLYKKTENDNRNYELSTIANDNLSSYRRNQFRIKSPSIDRSTTISHNNNSTIKKNKNSNITLNILNDDDNFKLKKFSSKKSYVETEPNSGSLDLYKNNKLKNNEEKYNFIKEIKSIKKFINLSRRDKNIKNIMANRIAYERKNLDVIYKPIKIINDYQNYKQSELTKNKDDISTFLTENKEISKRNLIIKLLNEKKNNYNKEINERQKTIENNKMTLDSFENDFYTYQSSQKNSYRKIDDILTQLIIKNRKLLKEIHILTSEVRIKEDERQKFLERIDELRIVAKFVTKVLENNLDIFQVKIIPEYSSERLPNYELISKELFERFHFLLNEDGKEIISQEDINILKQLNHLNDSELLYSQFHKIEEDIINVLNNKEAIIKEITDIKKEGKRQNRDIQKRIDDLENELNSYKSLYEREKKDYDEIYNRNYTGEGEFDDIIKDLYYDVMGIDKNNKKMNKGIVNVNRAALDVKTAIIEKEININKLIMTLEEYEKDNNNLFIRVVHNRKNENKEMKINMQKQKIKDGEREKLSQLSMPNEKIVIFQRKCEPPFRPKKKEKIIKIDPEIVKELEDDELITYK